MPKSRTLAEEYIISIIPELDETRFGRERKKVDKEIKNIIKAQNKQKKDEDKTQKELNSKLKQSANIMKTMSNQGITFDNTIAATTGKVAVIVAAFKIIYDIMKKLVSGATDFSNKMISSSSAFVDMDTRSLMAQFGVGSQTATGISAVTGLMGITPNDMSLMTSGQMQLYSKLMAQWQAGMNSIKANDLEKFQEVMQSFQSEMASAKLQFQLDLYKMMVELAPKLEPMLESVTKLFRNFASILTSPLMKNALKILISAVDTFVWAINSILEILDFITLGLLGIDTIESTKSSGNINNSNVTIYNSQTNSFTGDNASMLSLANNVYKDQATYVDQVALSNGK